jgi:hypothetical protein
MKLISRITTRVVTSSPIFLISFRFLLLLVQFHLNGTFHVIAEFPAFVLYEVHCESSYLLRLNLISVVNMVLALNGKRWHVNFFDDCFYLQQNGTSSFSLWYFTQASQSLCRGHSFLGQGQLGADTGM